jgi:SPOR domain
MTIADRENRQDDDLPEDFGDREPIDEPGDAREYAAAEPDGYDEADPFDREETSEEQRVAGFGRAAPREPGDQLELGDDDAGLPWLEGDEDFDDDRGSSGGQMVLLALLALSALAAIIGGIWWFTRGDDGDAMVADGSLIEAPAAPYKERPADPGGKTFEGTGDTSYAVSEGKTRPARLGEDSEVPRPGFETATGAAGAAAGSAVAVGTVGKTASAATKPATAAASPTPQATPEVAAGPAVQVGAFSTRAQAEAAWDRLTGSYSALSGQRYRVVEGRADIGTVYRLQALPGDAGAARALCGKLKSAGLDCAIKD